MGDVFAAELASHSGSDRRQLLDALDAATSWLTWYQLRDEQELSVTRAAGVIQRLVGGTWALSARYSRVQTDGYRDQSWVEQWNYFFSLARFGERSRLRLVLFGGPERTHLAYNGVSKRVLDGGLTGNADRDRRFNPLTWEGEIDQFTQPHFQLLHELSLGPSTELSQTFYAFQGQGFYVQFRTSR